jgi:hypothetical protein
MTGEAISNLLHGPAIPASQPERRRCTATTRSTCALHDLRARAPDKFGYKDRDGGYREPPDGKPLTLMFLDA